MRLNARTLLGAVAVVTLPAMPIGHVAPVSRVIEDGYTITMHTTGSDGVEAIATLKIAGDKMRIEADLSNVMGGGRGARGGGGAADAMTAGAFLLPRDGKLVMVAPNAPNMMGGGSPGMAILIDLNTMGGRGRGAATANDTQGTVEDLGAGESIAGHPTHRYRLKSNGGNSAEVWLSTDMAGIDYKKFAGAFGARFAGPGATMAGSLPTSGFVLKTVSTSGTTTTTMEVTKIEKSSFDASVFEVPAGIQVMDLGGMMGGRRGGGE